MKGYWSAEGDDLEIAMMVQRYTPYVYFRTFPVATIDGIEQMLTKLSAVK